jgi:hypothetical protein
MRRLSKVAGSMRRGSLNNNSSSSNDNNDTSITKTPLDDMNVQLSTKAAAASNRRMSASLKEGSVRIMGTTTTTTTTTSTSSTNKEPTRPRGRTRRASMESGDNALPPLQKQTASKRHSTATSNGDSPKPLENGIFVSSSNNNNNNNQKTIPLKKETAPATINPAKLKKTNDTQNNKKATRTRPTRQRSSSLSELRTFRQGRPQDDSTATSNTFSSTSVKDAVDRIHARIETSSNQGKRRQQKLEQQQQRPQEEQEDDSHHHANKKQHSKPSKQHEKQRGASGIMSSNNGNKLELGQPGEETVVGRAMDVETSARGNGDMLLLSSESNGMQTNPFYLLTTNGSSSVATAPTKGKEEHTGQSSEVRDRKARSTRKKPTRQRSKSLTSMGRQLRGGTRSQLARNDVATEAYPTTKTHTFFFDDDYRDNDPIVKLDFQEVEQSVIKLRSKVETMQKQLEDTQQAELSEIADEFAKCAAMKDGFAAAIPKIIHHGKDQEDAVKQSKDIIAYLKQENANRRKENKTLKVNLFDLRQKTVTLEKATFTTLKCLQELEEVHLSHELEKNELVYQNLAGYRRAHDKLTGELDRRAQAALMEHRICQRYNETIDAIQKLFQESCEDYDLVLELWEIDPL